VFDAYPDVPDLVAVAEQRISQLGGSDIERGGGRAFQIISGLFGWKFAKRCQLTWRGRARKAKPFAATKPT
jgi:hypothetical protein